MRKADHAALLAPGPHHVTIASLQALALQAHGTPRRQALWEGLCAFIVHLQRIDLVGMDLWLDGSFLTVKVHPSDVDAVLWVPIEHTLHCSAQRYAELLALQDRPAVRRRYGVDLYLGLAGAAHEEHRWASRFGTCHDDVTPKGFAILTL